MFNLCNFVSLLPREKYYIGIEDIQKQIRDRNVKRRAVGQRYLDRARLTCHVVRVISLDEKQWIFTYLLTTS